jgi:hypothetical protein
LVHRIQAVKVVRLRKLVGVAEGRRVSFRDESIRAESLAAEAERSTVKNTVAAERKAIIKNTKNLFYLDILIKMFK